MMRFSFVLGAAFAAAAPAQSPLTTTFASDNQGAPGGMVYFDLDVHDPAGVTVTQLDLNTSAATAVVEVFVAAGSRVGNEANPSAWTLVATGQLIGAGVDQPSTVCLGPGFHLPFGSHGVALRGDGAAHHYTGGAAQLIYGNADLTLTAGAASNAPFGGAQYAPRVWNGSVHYVSGANGVGSCAWVEPFGAGCYDGATSFYETFAGLGQVDLGGTSATPFVLAATAAGPAGYAVVQGSPQWFAPQGAPVSDQAGGPLDDDDVSEPLTLPFAFPFPGGSAGVVHATANGEVLLGPTAATTSDVTPNGFELLLTGPRLAPLWCDLDPQANAAVASSGVHFDVDPSGATVYVTWLGVADGRGGTPPAGATSIDVQCALHVDGSFEFRYGSIQFGPGTGRVVVGFGAGAPAPDPGPVDLDQSLPLLTDGPDRRPLVHTCTAPTLGATMSLSVTGVEAATAAFLVLGDAPVTAGVDLGFVGAPGCRAYTNVLGSVPVAVAQPVGAGSFGLAVPSAPNLVGAAFASQFVAPGAGNALGLHTSNGVRWIVGL